MHALVTGHSSGIGRAIASALEREGYTIVKLRSRLERLEDVRELRYGKFQKFPENSRLAVSWLAGSLFLQMLLLLNASFLHNPLTVRVQFDFRAFQSVEVRCFL